MGTPLINLSIMGRRYLVSPAFVLVLIIFCATDLSAQSLQRQSIGSLGFGESVHGFYVQESIAQSYFTSSSSTEDHYYNPGFLRPFTSVGMHQLEIQVNAYPNPTSDLVTLTIDQEIPGLELQVIDVHGRSVHSATELVQRSYTVSTLDWGQGIYFFQLRYKGMISHTTKIIVTH